MVGMGVSGRNEPRMLFIHFEHIFTKVSNGEEERGISG